MMRNIDDEVAKSLILGQCGSESAFRTNLG